ncbi:hypothetical protein ONS95_010117 [Cadophora gregata]|uniref:uncharacterized protein n=1 Tax=Cadophora gregata TaxID=51156 RepID=UPI0026DDB40A|nr:uncharacterized protein ONS95_010117 [Cadophora gregata]KAK0121837.1 hypothetical protein ONS95_010117 [Cadophora gregata]
MKRFRDLLPSSFGRREGSQHSDADASSETLLANQLPNEAQDGEKEEIIYTHQDLQNGKILRIQIALGAWMVFSFCCILYIVLSLTDRKNNRASPSDAHDTPNVSSDMNIQLIIPTFPPHFPQVLTMLHSMACLITDISSIQISLILSSTSDIVALQTLLSSPTPPTCTSSYLSYNTTSSAQLTYPPNLTLYNLYDLLPPQIQTLTSPNDTSSLVRTYGKYKYQSIKKLAAAAYLQYDYGIWIDSEGLVVRPVEFREMVREWLGGSGMGSGPVVWTELEAVGSPRRNEWIVGINEGCAGVLGRTMESLGKSVSFWQGFTWIIEKPIIMDMINRPSRLDPNIDFFTRLLNAKTDIFEIVMYKIHIAGRKKEQSSSNSTLYTKYRVLDMQNTLIDFGLGSFSSFSC